MFLKLPKQSLQIDKWCGLKQKLTENLFFAGHNEANFEIMQYVKMNIHAIKLIADTKVPSKLNF